MMIEPLMCPVFARALTAAVVVATLSGCAAPIYRAPVEDRGIRGAPAGQPVSAAHAVEDRDVVELHW